MTANAYFWHISPHTRSRDHKLRFSTTFLVSNPLCPLIAPHEFGEASSSAIFELKHRHATVHRASAAEMCSQCLRLFRIKSQFLLSTFTIHSRCYSTFDWGSMLVCLSHLYSHTVGRPATAPCLGNSEPAAEDHRSSIWRSQGIPRSVTVSFEGLYHFYICVQDGERLVSKLLARSCHFHRN